MIRPWWRQKVARGEAGEERGREVEWSSEVRLGFGPRWDRLRFTCRDYILHLVRQYGISLKRYRAGPFTNG